MTQTENTHYSKTWKNLCLGICVWSPSLGKVLLPHPPHDIALLTYNPSPHSGADPKLLLPACNRVRLAGPWTRKKGRVVPLWRVKPKCVKGTVNITESKNWEISEEIKERCNTKSPCHFFLRLMLINQLPFLLKLNQVSFNANKSPGIPKPKIK